MKTLLSEKQRTILKIILSIIKNLPTLVILGWFSLFLYYLSDRTSPATLYDGKSLTEHIQSGKPAIFSFKIDRNRVCRVQYNQTLYDSTGTRFVIPSYTSLGNRKIVLGEELKLGIILPEGMAKGPARYFSERQYACNYTHLFAPIYSPNPDIYFNVE